jgi:hypothetical protein
VLADVHAFHAVPAAASEYSYVGASSVFGDRGSADGDMTFLDAGQVLTSTARFGLAPSSFYIGAATFEQGSPLQPVVGRTLTQADLVNWRLSNGLVRVTPNATAGKIDVSHYDGTVWDAIKTYVLSATQIAGGPDQDRETILLGGLPTPSTASSGVLASFKPATTIALVGAVGAFTTGGASTVSPPFGQATVAAHLLVAWVTATNSPASITTGAAGWVKAVGQISSSTESTIWYKPNCGAGETAPTFTCTGGSSVMYAQLAEFSGALTASPLDKTGSTNSPPGVFMTITTSAADSVGGDLMVSSVRWWMPTASTAVMRTTYNNSAAVNIGNSGAASVSRHSNFSYGIIGAAVPVSLTGLNSLTVLRNSVEETDIRLSLATSAGTTVGIVLLDLSLRRGDRLVRLYVSSATTLTFKLARDSVEAATAITYGAVTLGGIRATADDGDGNRYIILSVQRATPANDLTNGAITQGATGLMADYAIGSEIGGSTATPGLDDAVTVAKQYIAAQSESQRIVPR